ncbi:hypothetical protein AGDE_15465 [Angomonas deanei]|uniref:Uncharacterized protein n=1 Tax=Angomonas deanei TaxID=59799 RepID=A0A7G2CWH4_9TRYP|nr:hypothetical protein AGDE_15465 [Angomonas deanei]CAD2222602.1 hypothetical protein, conserved [Angomonas deanei]|eukprot:EPY19014.1 hypothetical protein AGDE_15465 [Angomonas deanei]
MPPKTATKGAAKKKAAAKKKVHFDAEDIEVNKKSGIVSGKKKQPTAKRPREEEEEEDVLESSDDEEEVSIHSSDADLSDEEEAALAPAEGAKGAKHYAVLRLRFLPPEFQEPQLFKFLGQFGATVANCFCVRSRRTHQSKGSPTCSSIGRMCCRW